MVVLLLSAGMDSCLPVYYSAPATTRVEVEQPNWAPQFDNRNLIRYYYFPDWGMYYDINNSEYVYMDEGNWYFSHSVPPRYAAYDLNSTFVVALDYSIYQPWMHHSLYSSHYPPYFYRTRYENDFEHGRYTRGYNENNQRPYYSNEHPQQSSHNSEPMNTAREGANRQSEQQPRVGENSSNQQNRWNRFHDGAEQNPNTRTEVHPVEQRKQVVIYSHPDVGKPVRVTRQMMQPAQQSSRSQPESRQQSQPQQQQQPRQQQQQPAQQGEQYQRRR